MYVKKKNKFKLNFPTMISYSWENVVLRFIRFISEQKVYFKDIT